MQTTRAKVLVKCYPDLVFAINWKTSMTVQDVLNTLDQQHNYEAVGLFYGGVVMDMQMQVQQSSVVFALIDSHVFHNSESSGNPDNVKVLK